MHFDSHSLGFVTDGYLNALGECQCVSQQTQRSRRCHSPSLSRKGTRQVSFMIMIILIVTMPHLFRFSRRRRRRRLRRSCRRKLLPGSSMPTQYKLHHLFLPGTSSGVCTLYINNEYPNVRQPVVPTKPEPFQLKIEERVDSRLEKWQKEVRINF